jgi:hypothetical protein
MIRPTLSGNSTTKAPKNQLKKQWKDDFAEITQAEEITRQKELDVVKAKVEREAVKAKAKLAKIELQREKLAADRKRRCERAEAKVMKLQLMARRDHPHGTHPNMHFVGHQSSAASSGQSSMHALPLQFTPGPSSYYHANSSPISFQDEGSAGSSMSSMFPLNSSHGASDVFIPEVENVESLFVVGRLLPRGE